MCFETKRTFLDDYPRLKREWNYQKNNELKLYPGNLSRKSKKKVWWKCIEKNHEWQAAIGNRTFDCNCPYCGNKKMCEDGSNSLYFTASEQLKKEWIEEKNGSMKLYSPVSGKKVWWRCLKKAHEW